MIHQDGPYKDQPKRTFSNGLSSMDTATITRRTSSFRINNIQYDQKNSLDTFIALVLPRPVGADRGREGTVINRSDRSPVADAALTLIPAPRGSVR